ncbi:MAG TPA: serine/threonine-protein kinase [Kofleriaceae bacterium]|nr:serine/threonine-protein kinase [Kofleriaceae bacterium]
MKVCPKCGKQFGDDANFCPTDAGKLQPIAGGAAAPASGGGSDLVGGRFQLGERIGGGATGEVFRAGDTQASGQVALKMVAPAVTAIPQVAMRAERELKQLERVGSQAIAKVVASGKQGQQLWIATELVEDGISLDEVVAARGALDPSMASDLVVAIGEALIEAAKVGVVHRDLAPKNVLLVGDHVKIINFCVPVPTSDKVPGVAEYVAPELIEGKPIDQRSNIYSLGALFYFLLTGSPPFAGSTEEIHKAHLAGAVMPPSKKAPVPADLDGLIAKSMERAAAKRYLTLRQFLDEVAKVAHGPQGGAGATQPFGAAGKAGNTGTDKRGPMASTLMGMPPVASAPVTPSQNEIKTRQMDVQIPPEALREAANLSQTAHGHMSVAPAAAAAAPAPTPAAPVLPQQAPVTQPSSPWSPPAGQPTAPPVAQPAPAAPVMPAPAAPQMPAPAAPVVAGQAGGKKKPVEIESTKKQKGKFRETMWFKKGELDAAAAEAAAEESQKDPNAQVADKADALPTEDRYNDDGSISRGDVEKYSLKTGATSMMSAIRPEDVGKSGDVSEREIIGEMKGGRTWIYVVIGIAVAGIIGLIAALAR